MSGLANALEAMKVAGVSMSYTETPLVVAEGNFAEHWDVVADIPADMAHDNGKF